MLLIHISAHSACVIPVLPLNVHGIHKQCFPYILHTLTLTVYMHTYTCHHISNGRVFVPPDALIPVGSLFIQCLGGKGITGQHAESQM